MTTRTALLVVDMIGRFDFEEGPALRRRALPMARRLARVVADQRGRGQPVIYANDNFQDWQMDFRQLLEQCLRPGSAGAAIAALLKPERGDYFVLKPKHSAFLASPLPVLLDKLQVRTLIVAGVATDSCVLATALDANMREFEVHVPSDCTAAATLDRHRRALALLRASSAARTDPLLD